MIKDEIKDKLPASFNLGGVEFTTIFKHSLERCSLGEQTCVDNVVKIALTSHGRDVNPKGFLNTFMHEFIHCALGMSCHNEQNNDEVFVQTLANMFTEFITTADWKTIEELKSLSND